MENDWRMHPLLSLQIYLSALTGKRGNGAGGSGRGEVGWRQWWWWGGGGVSGWRESRCAAAFHLVLAGSHGAAPAESCT